MLCEEFSGGARFICLPAHHQLRQQLHESAKLDDCPLPRHTRSISSPPSQLVFILEMGMGGKDTVARVLLIAP